MADTLYQLIANVKPTTNEAGLVLTLSSESVNSDHNELVLVRKSLVDFYKIYLRNSTASLTESTSIDDERKGQYRYNVFACGYVGNVKIMPKKTRDTQPDADYPISYRSMYGKVWFIFFNPEEGNPREHRDNYIEFLKAKKKRSMWSPRRSR